MSEFLTSFDNREIAVVFWLLVAVLGAAKSSKLRGSMAGVVRAFFVKPILVGLVFFAGYFFATVLLLQWLNIWAESQLKLTVLWFITAGCVGLFSVSKIGKEAGYFAKTAKGNFKLSLLLDFFVNLYRMPLLAELVFVPVVVLLGSAQAVSETKEEFASARKLFNGIAITLGVLLLGFAIWKTVSDFRNTAHVDTLRSLVLPLLFSLLLLPFLWIAATFVAYQEVFVRLRFVIKDESLHPYVKRSLLLKFRNNTVFLQAWFKASWHRTFESRSDVDHSIQTVLDGISAV